MRFKDKEVDISKCKMFRNISEKDLTKTLDQIHFQFRSFEKGQYIILRNTKCEELLILLTGTVKAELKNFSETTVKIAEIIAPDSLAPAFLFGETNLYPVDAMAATDVDILWIPKQELIKMLHINDMFLINFLDQISTRAQYLTDKMKFLSFQTIKGKLVYFLVKTANEKKTDEFKINKTQQEIAEIFGVTRPSLARIFKQLIDERLISVSAKEIKILNKEGLAKYLKYEDRLHT